MERSAWSEVQGAKCKERGDELRRKYDVSLSRHERRSKVINTHSFATRCRFSLLLVAGAGTGCSTWGLRGWGAWWKLAGLRRRSGRTSSGSARCTPNDE